MLDRQFICEERNRLNILRCYGFKTLHTRDENAIFRRCAARIGDKM
jgi:hypothetical protein